MKKVLVAFDGAHFADSALDLAVELNEQEPILLTGMFLPSIDYTNLMIYYAGGIAGPVFPPTLDTDEASIAANITRFKEFCVKNGIEHRVHEQSSGGIIETIGKEARYADLLLLCGDSFYSNLGEQTQDEYLEDTVRIAECPVVILPSVYKKPTDIILAFDGTESSVYAIKQFTYLLPHLSSARATVVYASPEDKPVPDLPFIEELAARHFKDLTFYKLEADAQKYFNTWMMDRGTAMLVTGSFGRTRMSSLFKKHFVREVLADHKFPIFVAHK